ncbi:MAG: hypothetical protein WA192_08565 [Candidatus Acidiferrales bacterium]
MTFWNLLKLTLIRIAGRVMAARRAGILFASLLVVAAAAWTAASSKPNLLPGLISTKSSGPALPPAATVRANASSGAKIATGAGAAPRAAGSPQNGEEAPATTPAQQSFQAKLGAAQKAHAANSLKEEQILPPANSPKYFGPVYRSALKAPFHKQTFNDGGVPGVIPENETDDDATGKLGSYQPGGPTKTATNAFFQSLGTNGRTCVTCHLPPDGMSVSVKNINDRYKATNGHDPIFAPVDGSNCPSEVPAAETSGSISGGHLGGGTKSFKDAHSLILGRGVFRIFLPLPADADFDISVVSDPYGCNTTALYNTETDTATGQQVRLISVYRRPLVSTNLVYVTKTRIDTLNSSGQPNSKPVDPVTGLPLPNDPATGKPVGGNIMWDGREPTLETQAVDATLGHAQAVNPPTAAQVQQIVDFETGIYSAQIWNDNAHRLTAFGGFGGPNILYGATPNAGEVQPTETNATPPPPTFGLTFSLYNAWATLASTVARAAQRESVARGQAIFSTRAFTIANVAGLNNIAAGPGATLGTLTGTCSSCHNQASAGSDSFPAAQHDLGIGGDNPNFGGPPPSSELPIFQITCKSGAPSGFHGATVTTNDPGLALITGKCADVGRLSVAPLRGLASHPPYFSDGSAAKLEDVVDFYNKRFSIGLSAQDKLDLVNFLNSL